MDKVVIKLFDVVDRSDLPEISVSKMPADGDPLEINGELFFVCEVNHDQKTDTPVIGVIPLVVKNPNKVSDIGKYINCLSVAHRKVRFRNDKGECDLDSCDEMIIS